MIRERKPLVHNITNYVVMNETANAILALGALPVMAHAKDEVREMVGLAGALVLNIGTLSEDWIEAMLLAGAAANARGVPVVLDPVGAGATTLPDRDGEADPRRRSTSRSCAGTRARSRRSSGSRPRCAASSRSAAAATRPSSPGRPRRTLGVVASVTGPVDHVSDGERAAAVANGHELLAAITGTGCMSTALTGCFLAGKDDPFEAAVEALVAFGVAGEDAAAEAKGPGSFHVALYDALAALDPSSLTAARAARDLCSCNTSASRPRAMRSRGVVFL